VIFEINLFRYSAYTISRIVEDLNDFKGKVAFLSTPSIYFSLEEEFRKECFVFDFDRKWESDRGFVFYDFNHPNDVPSELSGSFDCVVVDPPFITKEVWEKYAATSRLLLKPGGDILILFSMVRLLLKLGRVMLTTILENEQLLSDLLGAKPTVRLSFELNKVIKFHFLGISAEHPEFSLSISSIHEL
jgi:hypothetical protein